MAPRKPKSKAPKVTVKKQSPNLGGTRRGAGRPKGSITQKKKKRITQAADGGLLPHEILLKAARGEKFRIRRLEVTYYKTGDRAGQEKTRKWIEVDYYPNFEEQQDAAKAAAPYYTPKLAAPNKVPGSGVQELHLHFDTQDEGA